jgi:hypothetical protein
MDLNTISLSVFGCMLLYGAYLYWKNYPMTPIEKSRITPWGEQVGRSKNIQSKTGDASLFIQSQRRTAIKNGGFGINNMEGAVTYYAITRLCPCPIGKPCCCGAADGGTATNVTDTVYDGGNADDGSFNFDGGNA